MSMWFRLPDRRVEPVWMERAIAKREAEQVARVEALMGRRAMLDSVRAAAAEELGPLAGKLRAER